LWSRNADNKGRIPGAPLDEEVFDRPGDINSIPRDGAPRDADHPEFTWARRPSDKIPGIPEDEDVFDRPGDLRSIPREGRPKDDDEPDVMWSRNPAVPAPLGTGEPEDVYDRPGDVRSIPRDGKPPVDDEPMYDWERNDDHEWYEEEPFETPTTETPERREREPVYFEEPFESPSVPPEQRRSKAPVSFEEEEPEHDWSADKPEDALWSKNAPEYDWAADKPEDALWSKNEPEYDWSGGRPDQLVEPDFDWSSDKPEDALVTKKEPESDWLVAKPDDALYSKQSPEYDWSGARELEPYERPAAGVLSTLPTTPLDEVAPFYEAPPDDLSEYTEMDEDKPKPVTGVPCAAWTMLALGAAAGATAGKGSAQGNRQAASHFANNPTAGTTTDKYFPDPANLPSCASDPNCAMVMDGLSPILPPDVLGLFDIPGTCQTKARDWLRTGKDILEFKAERIRQRYAMTVFFCEMDGGDWIENDSWLSDLHECDWYNKIGLDPCNRVEQMEMVRITDNGLAGTLPVEMFILSNLYEFTLANNLMTGELPQLFDKFKELDTLVIPFNQFGGTFPHQVWEYEDMVYLDVAYNGFTGTIPEDIDTRMPNLEVMFLENNEMSGPVPENLGNLQKLQRLHLDDNQFTGTIPATLGKPPRMSELLLHDNKFEGTVPRDIGDLNRLKLLTLHYNSLEEQTIDDHICELMYTKQLELATVDVNVNCECCSDIESSYV
jgi:hypothetical protein